METYLMILIYISSVRFWEGMKIIVLLSRQTSCTHYYFIVHHFSHYPTGTPPAIILISRDVILFENHVIHLDLVCLMTLSLCSPL